MRDELTPEQKERQKKEDELREKSCELGLKRNYPHILGKYEDLEQQRIQEIEETKKQQKEQFMNDLRQRVATVLEKMEVNQETISFILNKLPQELWKSQSDFYTKLTEIVRKKLAEYKRDHERIMKVLNAEVDLLVYFQKHMERAEKDYRKAEKHAKERYDLYFSEMQRANDMFERYDKVIQKVNQMKKQLVKRLRRMGEKVIEI